MGGTINESVVVPSGSTCVLEGARVHGNVRVLGGVAANFSHIDGNLVGEHAAFIDIGNPPGSFVGGSFRAEYTSGVSPGVSGWPAGANNAICNTVILGEVEITHSGSGAPWSIGDESAPGTCTHQDYVGGELSFHDNAAGGLISANDVDQGLNCFGNTPAPKQTNGLNEVAGEILGQCASLGTHEETRDPQTDPDDGGQFSPIGGALSPFELLGGGGFCLPCLMKSLVHAVVGKPVDTESGNLYQTVNDIQIPGRGFPLALTRTYNSMAAGTNGPLGYGWVDNLGAKLTASGSTAMITEENGAQTTFTLEGGTWRAPPRDIATLAHNGDGTWRFVRHAQQTLTFNSSGQLTSMSDLNGNTLTYSYTEGKLTTVTDAAGRKLTLTYGSGHLESVTDPNVTPKRVVSFKYDEAGNLSEVIDVNGGHTQFTYDGAHRMLTMKDPHCYATEGCPGIQNVYDSQGRVKEQFDELNRKTTFSYEGEPGTEAGGTTTITDPKGNVTVDNYKYGVKVSETRGAGTAQAATTSYLYDPATLQPLSIIDPNGHKTTMTYDGSGNMLSRTDPLGRTTTDTYNALNEPLTETDPLKVTTTMTYDGRGNLESRSRPLVGTKEVQKATYRHEDATHPGDVTSMTDAAGKTWKYTYGANGDLEATTDPLGHKTTSSYNAIGWMLSSVSARGNAKGAKPERFTTTYRHNNFGRVTETIDPLGHKTLSEYDGDQNLISSKDANGNVTNYTFDLADEQTAVHRADGTTLETTYWPDGTVKEQIDGAHHVTKYEYDALRRRTAMTDPLERTTHYGYDLAGNETSISDPEKQVTLKTYDAANELISVSYSDGKTPNVRGIEYDADGQRTAMTDGTGTSAWAWDSLHRLTSMTDGAKTIVGYKYDLRNGPTEITYPGGLAIKRAYDAAGRLTKVTDWLGKTTTFAYDQDGNLTKQTVPSSTTVVDSFTYDDADRLTSIRDKSGTTTIFSATYGRDESGQLASDTSVPAAVAKYKYTSLNQLCYAGSTNTSACSSPPTGSEPYAFDSANNLTTNNGATQQFDSGNQLCWKVSGTSPNNCATSPAAATTYAHDERGNRTAALAPGNAGTCDAYDQANRLTSVTTGTGSSCASPATVGTYAYDGSGLRMSKTASGATTQFSWGEWGAPPLQLQERAGTANPVSYIYGPEGVAVEQIDTAGNPHYYHHDQLGSTRAVTNSSGAVDATYTYDPYGNVTTSTNPGAITNPFMFTGGYRDTESGLYYLRARYYDPKTAQFLTRDPAVAKTRSSYAYVDGNPLNSADPAGLGANLPLGLCLKNPFSSDDSCESTGAIIENTTHVCTVFDGNCNPILPSAGLCANASYFSGLGGGGSVCIVETNGYQHGGFTWSLMGGAGYGKGASVGVEGSNAECPEDYEHLFNDVGGSASAPGDPIGLAGSGQLGYGTHGQRIGVGYLGASLDSSPRRR